MNLNKIALKMFESEIHILMKHLDFGINPDGVD